MKILIDGVEYKNAIAAAKKLGVNYDGLVREIKSGKVSNRYTVISKFKYGSEPTKATAGNNRSVVIDGVSYLSIRLACEKLGITATTLYKWIRNTPAGEPIKTPADYISPTRKPCTINGVHYESNHIAAKALKISRAALRLMLMSKGTNGVVDNYKPKKGKNRV